MNRITLVLAAACIGLAALSAWLYIDRSKLADHAVKLEKEVAMRRASGGNADEGPRARGKSSGAVAKAVATEETGDETGAKPDKSKDSGKSMAEGLAKMMGDPKMRDMMKAQARMGIDMMYRDLFDLLNLPEPQRTQFEKLITEKATAGMDAGFALMSGDKTAEEKKAAGEEVKAKTEEIEKKIKDLLGQEDYDRVKRYEDSTMERMQIKTFSNMLATKDLTLDEATETKLMDAMYQEREKFPFAKNFVDQHNPDISRFTAENAAKFGEEYAQLNQKIAERATGILSPAQLEVFRQSQEQHVNMTKMQMEMGAKMFGGGDKK